MLKLSKYNFFFETNDNRLGIFNLITRRIDGYPKEHFIISKEGSKTTVNLVDTRIDYPPSMYSNGIILDKEIDEMIFVRNLYNSKVLIHNPEYLALTVIPTLRCNFNCCYCYEHKSNNLSNTLDMPESILNELYLFIQSITRQIRKLHINFYGGEPLIDKNKFISTVGAIKNICDQNKCQFSVAIITNGYNLDNQVVDFLFDLWINVHLQITLDGSKEIHDKKRILHNGAGTFDRIISNLKYLKEKIDIKKTFDVNLRVNVNADDHNSFYELCQFLQYERLFDDFGIYAATIFDEEKYVCSDVNKYNAFDEVGYRLNKYVAKLKGKEYESSCTTLFSDYQLCTQLMRNALLIDPAGDIYKCYMDITDPSRCVGNILETHKLRSNKTYLDILTKTKMDVPMCLECPALPLCITYCPRDTIVKNICHGYKEWIKHELEVYWNNQDQSNSLITNIIGFLD